MQKKLYRSRTQKVIAGVCGGVAEYFNIDVTLIRLVWVIFTLPGLFPGVILYIVAAIIIPESPNAYYEADKKDDTKSSDNFYNEFKGSQSSDGRSKFLVIIGLILIVVGGLTLFRSLFPPIWHILKRLLFPISIIVAGGALIYSATKK